MGISIVQKSDVINSDRIDAEYFSRILLKYNDNLKNIAHDSLLDISEFLIGPFGSAFNTENYVEEGTFRYVRGKDVKPFTLLNNDNRYIPEEDYHRLRKYALKENDILVSVVGTLGNACIIEKHDLPAIFSCKSTVIRAKNMDSHCLLAYLNCKYGRQLLLRNERGANQKGLNLSDLQTLIVPRFTKDFQKKIGDFVRLSFEIVNDSNKKYASAEKLLISELGIDSWGPEREVTSVRNLKEVMHASRIDAEYYHPKYDELFKKLKKHTCKSLKKIVHIKKSIEPGSDAYQDRGIPFYRVSNLSKEGLSETDIYLDETKYYTEELSLKKDTILLSKDGSIGIAYKIEEDLKAITSSALLHLTVITEDVLLDYLTLVLNSEVVKLQAEQDAGGSIIQHWKPSKIAEVIIPILDMSVQEKIAALIKESFKLRKESRVLLEKAKRAVELAIEEGEKKAVEFLKADGNI